MSDFLLDLQLSTIALPFWSAVGAWLLIFSVAHALHRRARWLSSRQRFIVAGGVHDGEPTNGYALVLGQMVFASAVFAIGAVLGGAIYTFFVGGWIVVTAVSIAVNLRSILFLTALASPGAAEGALVLSTGLSVRDAAFQLFGMAAMCFCLGMLLAHLALLGGAFFMTATGVGYLRKSRALRP